MLRIPQVSKTKENDDWYHNVLRPLAGLDIFPAKALTP